MTERIPPLEPPYPSETAATLESMMPPGVEPLRLFRTLAHNPRVLGKIRGGNLLDRGSIERRDREIVILRTCARCHSEYEWGVHVTVFASRFDIPPDKVAGTRLWRADDPRWTAHEQVLLQLVDTLHDEASVPDHVWRALGTRFTREQLVELVVLTGFYHTISFVTNAFDIECEPTGARFPAPESAA